VHTTPELAITNLKHCGVDFRFSGRKHLFQDGLNHFDDKGITKERGERAALHLFGFAINVPPGMVGKDYVEPSVDQKGRYREGLQQLAEGCRLNRSQIKAA